MFDALLRSDPYFAALCILLLTVLVVVFLYLTFERLNHWLQQRSEKLLRGWVEQNGFQLLNHERRFEPGPFPWLTTMTQTIYHVVVIDDQRRTRRGWLRCGRMLVGVIGNKVEVRWEDNSR